ncbi:hypothetical protein GGI07_003705 [Coemansia sp. Benny D115]|nr:hypothetical protein GGI07_003705 [Coemansia sp. Benny D115]
MASLTTAAAMATTTVASATVTVATALVTTYLQARDDDYDESTISEVNIDANYLFDWGNAPGTGPYFSANNIDAATQITTAALMGGACLFVFSMLRLRWPELYSHRLRLRHMRPPNIPRTLFGWVYPIVTMSDRHVLETIGLDALLFFRAYRMFIYMFLCLSVTGMSILYPVNYFWGKEQDDGQPHTVFDSPLAHVANLNGRYSAAHVVVAYVFAITLFFFIDRFALHTVTMRWHYLLLTRRSGNSRTLMVTHLPRELRSESALRRFIMGMQVGEVETVHVAPMDTVLNDALAHRTKLLERLESAYAQLLGNPCRARSYDPVLLKRLVLTNTPEARALEEQLLHRWARREKIGKGKGRDRPVSRPRVLVRRASDEMPAQWTAWRKALWPFEHVDAIDHWRVQLAAAEQQLHQAREKFYMSEAGTVAFVTMRRPTDAYVLSQLNVHSRPDSCKIRMAPEARSIVWKNAGKPYSKKMLRYVMGLLMTIALLLLWCVPVILISTLISLRFLVTRIDGLVDVVKNNKFVRSLLNYTLPSLMLTIFLTILPRLLWSFVLVGGDRAYSIADKNMFIRHLYLLVIYIVIIFGVTGPIWSSIYDMFTDIGSFWNQLVRVLPQMAAWYSVYVMLYGAGYQVMKLLHLKSVCRYLFLQAKAHTPRDYMKAISPVFIDWGTFQPYTVVFFFIGILYSQLQPLLLPMTVLYYIVGLFVMKYMCVYAWYFRQQNAGTLWPVIIRRMVVCIMAYQLLITAIFASNNNHWFVAPMVVLMLFTWYYFWVRCRYLKTLATTLPLQLIREADRRREIVLAREKIQAASAKTEINEKTGQPFRKAYRTDNKPAAASDTASAANPKASSPSPLSAKDAGMVCTERMASLTAERSPEDELAECAQACNYNDQALVSKKHHTQKRTPSWLLRTLGNAIVHPIEALIISVSFILVSLQGDPAGPLWTHIDDYAFPERVDPLARPAGRSPLDPTMAKEQPGSLVDIFKHAFNNIPSGVAGMAREFFMDFTIPRAHLDSSVVNYPQAVNTQSAFEFRHRRRKHEKRDISVKDIVQLPHQAVESDSDSSLSLQPTRNSVAPAVDMNFCLAPASDLPADFVARIHDDKASPPSAATAAATAAAPFSRSSRRPAALQRATTYMPRVDPNTGRLTAMQYQMLSSELPHGTRMNRKRTDFSQPNMSYLNGVLDSTQFSYLHPGLYGDLPSLWLPVQNLRKRKELHRSNRQRLRDARDALEGAIENNLLGEEAVEKLYLKSKNLRDRLARFDSRRSSESAGPRSVVTADLPEPAGAQHGAQQSLSTNVDKSVVVAAPPGVTAQDVQRKMEDIYVEKQCANLGINPTLLSRWDPMGFHSNCNILPAANIKAPDAASDRASTSIMDVNEDMEDLLNLSGSESDNTDTESPLDIGNTVMRSVEEGNGPISRRV